MRIVSDELWYAAQARLKSVNALLGTRRGRQRDLDSPYVLSGFARCATCGGAVCAMRNKYGCATFHKKGTRACTNALRLPMDRMDDAVLRTLMHAVRPKLVMAILDGVLEQLTPRARARDVRKARATLERLDHEISNLTRAIALGGELESLVVQVREREASRREQLRVIAAGDGVRHVDRATIERTVRGRLDHWRALATQHVAGSRQFLREVLNGPVIFTPEAGTYLFAGVAGLGWLIENVVDDPRATFVVRPAGIEPAAPRLGGGCSIR